MRIVLIDLFCGTGGFTHGWLAAGGEVAVAVDSWKQALDNHTFNHPNIATWNFELGGDIAYVAETLRMFLKRFGEDIHLHIHGSPPCQHISNASMGDPEEGMVLVNWFLDLVQYMKPDSWSMEQVLPVAKRLPDWVRYVKVNAADFGVPQKRRRIFAGDGWELFKTHSDNWVSVKDAIPSLENAEFHPVPSMKTRWKNLTVNGQCPTITSQSPGQIRLLINTGQHSKSSSRRARSVDTPIDEPCKTVVNKIPNLRKEHEGVFEKVRALSVEETAIIQGWSNMKFLDHLTLDEKRVMVGNMVCPPIAFAIKNGLVFKELVW